MSTSGTTPEHAPPSVQVITPTYKLVENPWKPGKILRSEAVAYGKTGLPINAVDASGCKVCFCGNFPCPICMYVIPACCITELTEPGCIFPIPCCFGVPIPNFFCCAGGSKDGDRGNLWEFIHFYCDIVPNRTPENAQLWECLVVDKQSGMINVYWEGPTEVDKAGEAHERDDYQCCTCVPIPTSQILTGCSLVFGLIFSFIRIHSYRMYRIVF